MNNVDVLKKALIIKPLIFNATSEEKKTYNFVNPYFIGSLVRPVTDDDIKTLKTYLNAIIKLDRYHGTANVAEITSQGAKENTQSSADVARFLGKYNISYDMFDNKNLEDALDDCKKCNSEPQEDKTKEKAIKFLQTLIKQPLINKKASDQVKNYLKKQKITYSAVSKKSLRKAIKDCKNKPVCQNFKKEDKQNAINYLTGLLNGKRARKIKTYQDVRNAYASKVAGVLQDLNIGYDNSVIQRYLRKEHTKKLEDIVKDIVKDSAETTKKNSFETLIECNPESGVLGKYAEACEKMIDAIGPLLTALNAKSKNVEEAYTHYTETLVTNAKGENKKEENEKEENEKEENEKEENAQEKVLIPPHTANVIRSLGDETATMASITHGMESAGVLVKDFDKLVKTAAEVLGKIEPLAAYLKRWSGKARMLGKATLYTKMSDSLEEQLGHVRGQIESLISARNTLICVGCGLLFVDTAGSVCTSTNSVMKLLRKLEKFNNISTSTNNRLTRGETLTGSYVDLLNDHKEQSENIQKLTKLVEDETATLKSKGLASGRKSPGLTKFVEKMNGIFETARSSVTTLSARASGIDGFIREAKQSVVGRIALFKEKHRVSIDTAKALTNVVQQVVNAIPK